MSKDIPFAEQYNHPKWQERRLHILERAGWKCEACGEAEKQLNVHHKLYVRGRKVWEYEDDELRALCKDCHNAYDVIRKEIQKVVGSLHESDAWEVLGFARASLAESRGDVAIESCCDFEHFGILKYFDLYSRVGYLSEPLNINEMRKTRHARSDSISHNSQPE